MKSSRLLLILVLPLLCTCTRKEPQGCFPNEKLPPEISPLTSFGQRAEWSLDGAGKDYTRVTYFNDVEGVRASNPVVRDDGWAIAFQASLTGSDAGVGCGLYIYRL